MQFTPYVFNADKKIIPVSILKMSNADADTTNREPKWQTSWTSDFLRNPALEKYAVKIDSELIAFGAYEILQDRLVVHIVYMESHPESNPTMDNGTPKYTGIGRLLIAYGIKLSVDNGFGGDVVLEAKTNELAKHYANDFGAVALPSFNSTQRFLIADNTAKNIFFSYLR